MKKSVELTGKKQCLVELGIPIGKREAFAALAGRCSAAQAESLRRIHGSRRDAPGHKRWRAQAQGQRLADNVCRVAKPAGQTKHGSLLAAAGQLKGLFARAEIEIL